MLIDDPDLLNSCRVCRSPNQDGEYECLYTNSNRIQEKPKLSEAGILYENLLDISLNVWDSYPQFLCNSCDLQMRLFKKLKDKAYKTLEYLMTLQVDGEYRREDKYEIEALNIDVLEEQADDEILHTKERNECEVLEREQEDELTIDESYFNGTNDDNYTNAIVRYEQDLETNSQNFTDEEIVDRVKNQNSEYLNLLPLDTLESTNNYIKEIKLLEITEVTGKTEDKLSEITLELGTESIIDKNDYVTEIYVTNHESINGSTEILEDYDQSNTENSSVFNDVEYILDENEDILQELEDELSPMVQRRKLNNYYNKKKRTKENNQSKKEYKCGPCQLDIKSSQEYKNHRKTFHNDKYPCSVCTKELKSLSALHTHMKLHNIRPAYQCEICQKTFNQRSHFQYHMNHHNNVRNFKCSECDKAFLSNSDLKTHMRFHSGQRPYVCNICGKDYLMMEHLKSHVLTHSEVYFQCDICQHKFATHKTLRTHMKTIHEDEPRFKCSYCGKAFRRKHHLEYHLRLHQKSVQILDNSFQLIDHADPDNPDNCEVMTNSNADDLIEQELVDDPGFVAL